MMSFKIGDLVETHGGVRGLILDTEDLYPGNPYSPVRNVLIHWINEPPAWHVEGRYTDVFAVKKIGGRRRW